MEIKKLDNPIWYSLTETHSSLVIDFIGIKFYQPYYCPFGGFTNNQLTEEGIDKYSLLENNFYIVGERPFFNDNVSLKKELVCQQMLLEDPIDILISENIVRLETAGQQVDLYNLVNLVQPGYFKNRTCEMGDYYGIYSDNKLIAVTGERMKMHNFTEVSAVITHPEYLGKGYAKQLVAFTSDKIFKEKKIPFLHVAETNGAAITLYEKLGFKTRRKISFWNFTTNNKQI